MQNLDFLNFANSQINFDGDIIMNPPYYDAGPFVQKALDLVRPGKKVVAFLRLLFLEGQGRYESIFKNNPPKIIIFHGCNDGLKNGVTKCFSPFIITYF